MPLLAKKLISLLLILFSVFLLGACSSIPGTPTSLPVEATQILSPTGTLAAASPAPTETKAAVPTETEMIEDTATSTVAPTEETADLVFSEVLSVAVSGGENAYRFSVEIRSPDTGCEQYADWWEVISEDGDLIYRRILVHSHVTEQPFTRSGGPVAVNADTVVIVRAHMHPGGYGAGAFQGSVAGGFEAIQLEPDFAKGLDEVDPLPDGCGF